MTDNSTPENQTLALAGIFQGAFLARNLATFGRCDEDQLRVSLESILMLDVASVTAVYGGAAVNLRKGLRVLREQLRPSGQARDLDISRYCAAMIQLADNVIKNTETTGKLQQELTRLQTLEFDVLDPTMINALANTYRTCISQLSPRIMVNGQPEFLNNDLIAAKIRAALLSGLRSAVLWRQCGGSKLGLLISRGRYLHKADQLLKS